MNAIAKFTSWGDRHHPAWLDVFRIVLGSFLFYKGIVFVRDGEDLRHIFRGMDLSLVTMFLNTYIPLAHFAGGLALAIGLITRWAALVQIPVLVGAVILNGQHTGMFDVYSEFWLSLVCLAGLLLFFVIGSGPISADGYIRKYES
ncbi:MAG TPA: DoxX family protein [Bacteroidia bacterium]|jgi:uncharacterized membrane protein YphA (DoxX/SURF4 family)|nr:DoxX family protein [Bacteroidia bacterium]